MVMSLAMLLLPLFPCEVRATSESLADVKRARSKIPRRSYQAPRQSMSEALNKHLRSQAGAIPCDEWGTDALQTWQSRLLNVRSVELNDIYIAANDARRLLVTNWDSANSEAARGSDELRRMQRDSHCREAVMWFVHHLSEFR